jgi:hypothetical protein
MRLYKGHVLQRLRILRDSSHTIGSCALTGFRTTSGGHCAAGGVRHLRRCVAARLIIERAG